MDYGPAMAMQTRDLQTAADQYVLAAASAERGVLAHAQMVEATMGALSSGIRAHLEAWRMFIPLSEKVQGMVLLIAGSLDMTRAFIAIYRTWVTYYQEKMVAEEARSALLTAQAIASPPSGWVKLALAGGAAALVAGTIGYIAGASSDGGEVDISTAAGQRAAAYKIGGY